jgi:hypothetical protein
MGITVRSHGNQMQVERCCQRHSFGVLNLCSRAVEAPVIVAEWMQTAWLAPSCFGRPVSGKLAASFVGISFHFSRAISLARLPC